MVKIGVVSDTHSRPLPELMLADFRQVDFIIHAGDFCSLADYKALAKIKDVKAVHGNMDDGEIRHLFPRRQIVPVADVNIGIFHGQGADKHILESVQAEFKKDKVDIVIFGHSHQPYNESIKKVLYFNPGSPNDHVFAPYFSYGLIEVNGRKFSSKIIKVEKNG